MNAFWTILVFAICAFAFAVIILLVNKMLRPKNNHSEKEDTYECGVETSGPTWIQFKLNYFLYALLFVVFDVETVLLYPWAVTFKALGLFAFIEMLIFIAILAIGLWYAWKKGALEWK